MAQHRVKHVVASTVAVGIGLVFCVMLFRGTDWPAVLESMRRTDWRWLAAAAGCVLLAFFLQGARLLFVFRGTHPISLRHACSATQIFLFCRQMFPVRGGEIIRAFLLTRYTGLPFSKCFGVSVVDRIPEALVFFVILGLTMYAIPADRTIEIAPEVFQSEEPIQFTGAVIQNTALGLALFTAFFVSLILSLYVWTDTLPGRIARVFGRFGKRSPEKVEAGLRNFGQAMHVVHNTSDMFFHLAFTVGTLGSYLAALVCNFYAFNIDFAWFAPFLALTLIAFAAILPGMPGLVGQYHVAIVFTLIAAAPGMSGAEMKAVALVSHALQLALLAITAIGFLLVDRVSLAGLESLDRGMAMEEEANSESAARAVF